MEPSKAHGRVILNSKKSNASNTSNNNNNTSTKNNNSNNNNNNNDNDNSCNNEDSISEKWQTLNKCETLRVILPSPPSMALYKNAS